MGQGDGVEVDASTLVNDLGEQIGRQAVLVASLRAQLAQVTRERDLLLAEQMKNQSNRNENTEGGLP